MALFASREWHRMVRSPAQREAADHQPIHVQTALTRGAIALARGGAAAAPDSGRLCACWRCGRGGRVLSSPASATTSALAGRGRALSRPAVAWRWSALRALPPHGVGGRARPVSDRLGDRYRRAGVRQADRRHASGAASFARQDLGRHHRRQHHRGRWSLPSISSVFWAAASVVLALLFAFAVQLRRPWRRPVRILGQAPLRHQGFRRPDSRPWRRAGPHGFHLRRSVVLALLVFGLHLNPLFGGHA